MPARIVKAERTATVAPVDIALDVASVSATSIITTETIDRSSDIVVTAGIDTANHEANPVVLLEHEYPIGVSRSPDGLYTVSKQAGFATATTYFDPNNPLAVQTFRMIDDGILRGTSIGFVVRRAAILPSDHVALKIDADGDRVPTPKFGIRYDEIELVEYSHVILPDNPDALTVAVQKSRVGSEMMHPELRKLLAPYQIAPTVSITVPKQIDDITNAKPTEKSNVADEYIPEEEMKQQEPPADETPPVDDAAKGEELPPGARLLDGLYHRFLEAAQYLADEGAARRQENPDVLAFAEQAVAQIDEICAMISDTFDSLYPDLDSLTGKAADEAQAEDAEPAEDDEPEGKKIRARLAKRIEAYRKRMGRLTPLPPESKPQIDEASAAKIAAMEKQFTKLQKGYARIVRELQAARNGR